MNKFLRSLIFNTPYFFYVRVYKNRMHIRKIDNEIKEVEVRPDNPFSTGRLLVGEFSIAEKLLSNVFKDMKNNVFISKHPPSVVMQPMEMIDGQLSEVEERVFKELGYGAGAYFVSVWVGKELTDEEVKQKAKKYNKVKNLHSLRSFGRDKSRPF